MAVAQSSIEWTDATWSPMTGCSKVSPGCAHCYAETIADRFWKTQYPPVEYDTYSVDACCPITEMRARQFTDVMTHEDRLDQPLRWRKPKRIFVNSMSDLFHEDVPDAFIDKVFAVMALAPEHTFQVLTKRAERMRAYLVSASRHDAIVAAMDMPTWLPAGRRFLRVPENWPMPNVWLGVSVENQHFADERIPLLLQTPAAVRFISAEPLLGPVDLAPYLHREFVAGDIRQPRPSAIGGQPYRSAVLSAALDWVIVGGESGPGARPLCLSWVRNIVHDCDEAGVPCFVKQLGAKPYETTESDGSDGECRWRIGREVRLRDRKGGDPAEWGTDLRVRQFPEVVQ